MKSDGRAWRPLVHVEDVARACIAAAVAPSSAVAGEIFNIGRSNQNFLVGEVAAIIAREGPSVSLAQSPKPLPDPRSYRVSFRKAEKELPGFIPTWTLEEGVRQLYQAFADRSLAVEAFEGPRWSRIARLKERLIDGSLGPDLRPACGTAALNRGA